MLGVSSIQEPQYIGHDYDITPTTTSFAINIGLVCYKVELASFLLSFPINSNYINHYYSYSGSDALLLAKQKNIFRLFPPVYICFMYSVKISYWKGH